MNMNARLILGIVFVGMVFGFMPAKKVFAADNCRCTKATNNLTLPFRDIASFNVADEAACNAKCYDYAVGDGMYNFGSSETFKKVTSAPNKSGNNNNQISNYTIPGTSVNASSGLVKCGRPGQNMCTLCDLIAGLNVIIQYIMKIAIGVGLAAFTAAGVMYVVSAGDSGMTGDAKKIMKNAGIGFVVIFAAWLIVNFTISAVGTKAGMGINVTSWGQFDCNSTASQRVQ